MVASLLALVGAMLTVVSLVVRHGAAMSVVSCDPPSASLRDDRFVKWAEWPVSASIRDAVAARYSQSDDDEIELGEIDNDGRLLDRFGSLPDFPETNREEFVARHRFGLSVVLKNGLVLIRKDFRGDRGAFLREASALTRLPETVNAPAVYFADTTGLTLYKALVPGKTVREHLFNAGAAILTCQSDGDPELSGLGPQARIESVWQRGQDVLEPALGPKFLGALEAQLDAAHRKGVTRFSLTFGNVVVHRRTLEPWFIDFDAARTHRSVSSMLFRLQRDRDRSLFNRVWGGSMMTESEARRFLDCALHACAPVDLGGGLVTPGFWSVDSGMGLWEYLNGKVLNGLLEGRRVLDLGSNNGVMSLMMLRAGAAEVVGLERDPSLIEEAQRMHRVFEWHDMKSYALDLKCLDMRAVLNDDLGDFDIVTAFCSLYYLSEEDMRRVARAARSLAQVFVVQAKTNTRAEAADFKAKKSSLEYLQKLILDSGFGRVSVSAPPGCSRPLLIGSN
jgi:SAM-dependent methyltransferase